MFLEFSQKLSLPRRLVILSHLIIGQARLTLSFSGLMPLMLFGLSTEQFFSCPHRQNFRDFHFVLTLLSNLKTITNGIKYLRSSFYSFLRCNPHSFLPLTLSFQIIHFPPYRLIIRSCSCRALCQRTRGKKNRLLVLLSISLNSLTSLLQSPLPTLTTSYQTPAKRNLLEYFFLPIPPTHISSSVSFPLHYVIAFTSTTYPLNISLIFISVPPSTASKACSNFESIRKLLPLCEIHLPFFPSL